MEYSTIKSNEVLITSYSVDELWKHGAKQKKPDTNGQVMSTSIYVRCPE